MRERAFLSVGAMPHPDDEQPVPLVVVRWEAHEAGEEWFRRLRHVYGLQRIIEWQGHSLPPTCWRFPELQLEATYYQETDRAIITLTTEGLGAAPRNAAIDGDGWFVFAEAYQQAGFYLLVYGGRSSDPMDFRVDPVYLGTTIAVTEYADAAWLDAARARARRRLVDM